MVESQRSSLPAAARDSVPLWDIGGNTIPYREVGGGLPLAQNRSARFPKFQKPRLNDLRGFLSHDCDLLKRQPVSMAKKDHRANQRILLPDQLPHEVCCAQVILRALAISPSSLLWANEHPAQPPE
jgi:hypothetical protein